jgi:hypothetical protein
MLSNVAVEWRALLIRTQGILDSNPVMRLVRVADDFRSFPQTLQGYVPNYARQLFQSPKPFNHLLSYHSTILKSSLESLRKTIKNKTKP